MGLTETYARVQALKEEPWDPPPEIVEWVNWTYLRQYGRQPSSAELKIALDGIGWTTRFLLENHLNIGAAMDIAADIERNTRVNLARSESTLGEVDGVGVGVGAGFFTGLWVGLLLRE